MRILGCLELVFVPKIVSLLHIREYLRTTPSFYAPVFIVLRHSADTERAVISAATAYEFPSPEVELATVKFRARFALDVLVCICTEDLRDSGWYGGCWNVFF